MWSCVSDVSIYRNEECRKNMFIHCTEVHWHTRTYCTWNVRQFTKKFIQTVLSHSQQYPFSSMKNASQAPNITTKCSNHVLQCIKVSSVIPLVCEMPLFFQVKVRLVILRKTFTPVNEKKNIHTRCRNVFGAQHITRLLETTGYIIIWYIPLKTLLKKYGSSIFATCCRYFINLKTKGEKKTVLWFSD